MTFISMPQRTWFEGPDSPYGSFSKPVSDPLNRENTSESGYQESETRGNRPITRKSFRLLEYRRLGELPPGKFVVFFSPAIGTRSWRTWPVPPPGWALSTALS